MVAQFRQRHAPEKAVGGRLSVHTWLGLLLVFKIAWLLGLPTGSRRSVQELATFTVRVRVAKLFRVVSSEFGPCPIVADMVISRTEAAMETQELDAMLAPIRALPFVKGVHVSRGRAKESEAEIRIKSPSGVASFTVDVKKNYLDRSVLAALAATGKRLERESRPPLLLLARYVPRGAGEELVRSGICFADQSGNINLRLGERYHALVLGNRDLGRAERTRRLSPGAVQMLFVALARPELLREPVRQLAENAGVGKSTAAEVRRQLLQERLVVLNSSGEYRIADERAIRERFLLGYGQVLRPHLLLGRYRGPYKDGSGFVETLAQACSRRSSMWALTGSAGAYELDRFYRGEHTVAFVGAWDAGLAKELRLLPDTTGPITVLRPFGDLVVWSHPGERPVAHPWLIYAESLHDGDPRAIEAAEELRRNHLA